MTKKRMSNVITGDANHVGYGIEVLRSDFSGDEGVDFGYFEFLPEPIPNGAEIFANSNYIYKEQGGPETGDWDFLLVGADATEQEIEQSRAQLIERLTKRHGFFPRATLGFKAKVKDVKWTQR